MGTQIPPLWIIEHARLCKHSRLAKQHNHAKGLPPYPDYTCDLTATEANDFEDGRPCRLFSKAQECDVREPFPESRDH